MSRQCIAQTPSAFGSPLLIKGLLESGITRAPEQEIVFANTTRLTYRKFAERVGRLASGLASLGVEPGNTVAIMDWDTNRYLECFFAVPMMGAVLHTVNVRLSAEQILYTIDHAEDDVILINSEFLPLLEQIRERVDAGKKLVLLGDTGKPPKSVQTLLSFNAEYETLLAEAEPWRDFPDFDENSRATTFYTTGTTGQPKGVYFTHKQLVLHALSARAAMAAMGEGWFKEEEVYMPITPMFHVHAWGLPLHRHHVGRKAGLLRTLRGRLCRCTLSTRKSYPITLRSDDPADAAGQCQDKGHRPFWLEDDHWRRVSAGGARPGSAGAWARRIRRLWHVGDLSHFSALRSHAENDELGVRTSGRNAVQGWPAPSLGAAPRRR